MFPREAVRAESADMGPRVKPAGDSIGYGRKSTMSELLGGSIGDFIGVTLVLFGGSAFMTGQALAGTWRPLWQMVPYGFLLAAADRFFSWALFEGELLSPLGFAIDAVVIIVIGV